MNETEGRRFSADAPVAIGPESVTRGVPTWAILLGLGVAGFVWIQREFPTRAEEQMLHSRVEERFKNAYEEIQRNRIDTDNRLAKLSELLDQHSRLPYHAATSQSLAEHAIRLNQHDDVMKQLSIRLDTNENLLREIKASLDASARGLRR